MRAGKYGCPKERYIVKHSKMKVKKGKSTSGKRLSRVRRGGWGKWANEDGGLAKRKGR